MIGLTGIPTHTEPSAGCPGAPVVCEVIARVRVHVKEFSAGRLSAQLTPGA